MLRDLHLRNLAVVEEVGVEFGPGLNVLTGETGAGKSIVVDSLALLAGARASSELVRSGADLLSVAGIFEPAGDRWRDVLGRAGLESVGAELVVRREISRTGRNRVFVDDRPVTLGLLAEVAPHLLRIHTQREELGMVAPEVQRAWLDGSGGAPARELRRRAQVLYDEYAELESRLERVSGDDRLRLERIDLLRFQAGEIDAAKLQSGEEEALRRERDLLRHSEAIREALGATYSLLFDDDAAAADRISQAERRLEAIVDWQPEATDWVSDLASFRIGLEEMARELRQRMDQVGSDPARLNAVEERLAQLERLFRKYRPTCEEILAYRGEIGRELEELRGDSEERQELARKVDDALAAFREVATELSARRWEWGVRLAESVHRELADLAMKRARFAVRLERHRAEASRLTVAGEPVEFSAKGFDQVVFQLAANPGEEMLPLARCASGGELSRVYLALQLAVRGEGEAAGTTLVFDEVDSGIGGAEAAALGRKLQRLSRGGQILAVTHLPQVASHADWHFQVNKRVTKGRTRTRVEPLDSGARIEEVARMLAGKKVTDLSRSHAQELIAVAERSE
ncbi:MAG: DNA repair protein RecN [Thermoanaerobaculia bacterium]